MLIWWWLNNVFQRYRNCSVWEKRMLLLNGTSCPRLIILKRSYPFWQCWKQRCSDSSNRKIAHNMIFMELGMFFYIYRNHLIFQGPHFHHCFLKIFSDVFIQKAYFLFNFCGTLYQILKNDSHYLLPSFNWDIEQGKESEIWVRILVLYQSPDLGKGI